MSVLFQVFIIAMVIGMTIAFYMGSRNRNKRKKSYRRSQFLGYEKEIDQKIKKEDKSLLNDEIEYHASEKFK